jgi:crotonobetainyl-CoA:carnitine CoA-transferase CaiB-like acyl-CoA transferase
VGAINTLNKIVEHPVAGQVQIIGVPIKLLETPGSVWKPAPLLGQPTGEVLRPYLASAPPSP